MINPEISVASKSLSTVYENAANYPNIVFDDFLDPTLSTAVSNEAKWLVENIETEEWRFGKPDFHEDQVLKRGITEISKMPPAMRLLPSAQWFTWHSPMTTESLTERMPLVTSRT